MPDAMNDNDKNNRANARPIEYGALPGLLGYQLRRAQVMIFQHFAVSFGDRNITPGQLGLLILISENPGISQTALAKAARIERSTLGEVVGALEKRGLVDRRRMPRDRRSHAVHLSKQGRKTLDEIMPLVRAHELDATSSLSAGERENLLTLLRGLTSDV